MSEIKVFKIFFSDIHSLYQTGKSGFRVPVLC